MSYKPLKCTYTFKLVHGEIYKWELEVFFWNHGEKVLEPLSSSSQTVARGSKIPFGFIDTVTHLDSDLIGISNRRGDRASLHIEKLSPLLETDDTKLKMALLHFKPMGCSKVVGMLNQVIGEFHSESMLVSPETNEQDRLINISTSDELVVANSNKRKDIVETSIESGYMSNKRVLTRRSSTVIETQSISLFNDAIEPNSKDLEVFNSSFKLDSQSMVIHSTPKKIDDQRSLVKNNMTNSVSKDAEDLTIIEKIKMIIEDAYFKAIKFDQIIVPKSITVDQSKVRRYREYLLNTPDKTKSTLVGLIKLNDSTAGGKFECWVNVELFTALSHLSIEQELDIDYVLAVVHVIAEDDDIDSSTLGQFLMANSKDFDSKFSDKMKYQDLVRFSMRMIKDENTDEMKKFVRESLKSFSKGYRNSSTFLRLAGLPEDCLKYLEKFMALYETGSLCGMQVSSRKRCGLNGQDKRSVDVRIEVPIDILKYIIEAEKKDREPLLISIVNSSITLTEFKTKIEVAAGLKDVKLIVASVAEKSFDSMKNTFPSQLHDENLLEYIGAKSHPKTGPNPKHSKLSQFVKDLVEIPSDTVQDSLSGSLSFTEVETLGLIDLGKKIKEADIIYLEAMGGISLLEKFGYKLMEKILGHDGIVIYALHESKVDEIAVELSEHVDIVAVKLYFKYGKSQVENGIKKEIVPLLLAGHVKFMTGCGISNLFLEELKEVIPKVVNSFAKLKSSILCIFSSDVGVFDIDPKCLMTRKGASISYVGPKVLINDFRRVINS